jgi:hypothetical protein
MFRSENKTKNLKNILRITAPEIRSEGPQNVYYMSDSWTELAGWQLRFISK